MKRILFLVVAQLLVLSCTSENSKKASNESSGTIPFESKIEYVQKNIPDKNAAAEVDGEVFSWEQLNGSDPALAELGRNHNDQAIAFAYAWAQSLDSMESGQPRPVTFYGYKSESELPEILSKNNIESDENIELQYEEPQDSNTLAKAGGAEVSWNDFWKSNISHSKAYKKLFDQRMRRLNGMVIRRYILKASKESNQQMEEYIQSKIMNSDDGDVSEEEVRAFAEEKGISESDLDEKMMKRLSAIVKQNSRDKKMEAYVAKELQKEPVAIGFPVPSISLNVSDAAGTLPHWGGEDSSDLMFIGHWTCRDCPETLKSFLESKEKWKDDVHGLFLFSFPETDRLSRMGAEASLCVDSINNEAFWSFLGSMSRNSDEISEEAINNAAKESSIDFDKFRTCFLKREFQGAVDTHLAYAKKLGITSSPLLVLQGQVLPTPTDLAQITERIKNLPSGGKNSNKKGFFARIKAFFGF